MEFIKKAAWLIEATVCFIILFPICRLNRVDCYFSQMPLLSDIDKESLLKYEKQTFSLKTPNV